MGIASVKKSVWKKLIYPLTLALATSVACLDKDKLERKALESLTEKTNKQLHFCVTKEDLSYCKRAELYKNLAFKILKIDKKDIKNASVKGVESFYYFKFLYLDQLEKIEIFNQKKFSDLKNLETSVMEIFNELDSYCKFVVGFIPEYPPVKDDPKVKFPPSYFNGALEGLEICNLGWNIIMMNTISKAEDLMDDNIKNKNYEACLQYLDTIEDIFYKYKDFYSQYLTENIIHYRGLDTITIENCPKPNTPIGCRITFERHHDDLVKFHKELIPSHFEILTINYVIKNGLRMIDASVAENPNIAKQALEKSKKAYFVLEKILPEFVREINEIKVYDPDEFLAEDIFNKRDFNVEKYLKEISFQIRVKERAFEMYEHLR